MCRRSSAADRGPPLNSGRGDERRHQRGVQDGLFAFSEVSALGYSECVTELRVSIPDDVSERLTERAEAERTTPEQIARDAVLSYVGGPPAPASRRLDFIGIGSSGRSDISECAEEILRAELGA